MKVLLRILVFLLLFSCSAEKKSNNLLNHSNLTSFYITIDPKKDKIFTTPKGAVIKIPKGTFNEAVELEIKEAYSMQDILLAGLTTQSYGQPLTSGGMIYINTRNQQDVRLNNAISVAIPTAYINENMQLFKGEEEVDGSINWVEPDSLPATSQTLILAEGKQLFKQNCQTCHALDKNLTGPALRGFTERGSWRNRQNIYNWIHNPAAFISKDAYTQNLKRQYGVVMQAFPQLTNQQIDAMVAYIQNGQYDPTASWNYTSSMDSLAPDKLCPDTVYYSNDATFSDTIPVDPLDTTNLFDFTVEASEADPTEGLRGGFTDKPSSGAYEFQIQTLGWYNIDAYVKGLPGTALCDLSVQLSGWPTGTDMNVYVFFPRHKALSVGIYSGDGLFHFHKSQGKIPLFLGAEGFVVAFGSKGEQLQVGTARFFAAPSQKITVTLAPANEEQFLRTIKEGKLEGINFDLIKQKMAVEYRPCYDQAMPAKDSIASTYGRVM